MLAFARAVPRLQRKADRQRLSPIKGNVPSPRERPAGCSFTSRCPHAFGPCQGTRPERTLVSDGHVARCHLLETTLREVPA